MGMHFYRLKEVCECLACGSVIYYGPATPSGGTIEWRHVGTNEVRCVTEAKPPKTHEKPWQKPWPRKVTA